MSLYSPEFPFFFFLTDLHVMNIKSARRERRNQTEAVWSWSFQTGSLVWAKGTESYLSERRSFCSCAQIFTASGDNFTPWNTTQGGNLVRSMGVWNFGPFVGGIFLSLFEPVHVERATADQWTNFISQSVSRGQTFTLIGPHCCRPAKQ